MPDGSGALSRGGGYWTTRGLVSSVERKNGWQLAEQAGDATPDGVQRLLYNYRWDADLVRDDMKSYVVEHLSAADAVLVVDETGFLKKGEQVGWGAAAVQRDGGADRELSDWRFSGLCQRQGQNPAGPGIVPAPGVGGRLGAAAGGWGAGECRLSDQAATGPAMLKRALESGVPFGGLLEMRSMATTGCGCGWSEGIPHVLAIRSNEKLWVWTDKGLCQVRADRLTSQVDELGWTRCSAGDGAKGPRVYDWAVVEIRPLGEPGKGYWLLARRSIAQPGELAYFVCFGPAGTALEELVRVAGTRWAIEE